MDPSTIPDKVNDATSPPLIAKGPNRCAWSALARIIGANGKTQGASTDSNPAA